MPTKEEIYDSQINPLMAKIIEICGKHKIAHVCSFSLDADEGLCCTTCATEESFDPPEEFIECVKILYHRPIQPLMVNVYKDGRMVESNVVIGR